MPVRRLRTPGIRPAFFLAVTRPIGDRDGHLLAAELSTEKDPNTMAEKNRGNGRDWSEREWFVYGLQQDRDLLDRLLVYAARRLGWKEGHRPLLNGWGPEDFVQEAFLRLTAGVRTMSACDREQAVNKVFGIVKSLIYHARRKLERRLNRLEDKDHLPPRELCVEALAPPDAERTLLIKEQVRRVLDKVARSGDEMMIAVADAIWRFAVDRPAEICQALGQMGIQATVAEVVNALRRLRRYLDGFDGDVAVPA